MITKGQRRPGLAVAAAIERVSEGAIPMRDWLTIEKAVTP
jgi:hypothetical protein